MKPSNVHPTDYSNVINYKGINTGNTFVSYDCIDPTTKDYKLTFDTPNFEVPAGTYTIRLKFSDYHNNYEQEDLTINIINQRPTLSAPSLSTIDVYDDLVYRVNFDISDPESSPLLKLRFT